MIPKTVEKSVESLKTHELDLDKLAYSVARHETWNCTIWNSATRNNCFGIMTWKRGFREFKTYETQEDSYIDFKRIWTTKWYIEWNGGLPTYADAKKYSWNDRARDWLNNVLHFYHN